MKKQFFITLVIMFYAALSFPFGEGWGGVYAPNIDSLKLALKTAKHDTTRCNILNELAETASDEEWPLFNEELLHLAESKLKTTKKTSNDYRIYQRHLADALNNIGYLANNQGDLPKALEYYSKSLKIREEIGDKDGIASSLNNIGVIYDNQGDIPKALDLEYYSKSLKLQERNRSGTSR